VCCVILWEGPLVRQGIILSGLRSSRSRNAISEIAISEKKKRKAADLETHFRITKLKKTMFFAVASCHTCSLAWFGYKDAYARIQPSLARSLRPSVEMPRRNFMGCQ
jgi:hypothetical protein